MQKKFRGDDQWMLPSVSKKIDEFSESSSGKKKEKKPKKSKKSSKKHKKDRKKSKKKKRSTSNESDDSSAEERISKKKRKRKHFSDVSSESSSSSNESDEEDTWVEKSNGNEEKIEIETKNKNEQASTVQREDWLGGLSSLRTFSKSAPNEPKKDERKGIDSYDPGKSVRELNPFWKDGGDGLPKAFAKPSYDSDSNDEDSKRSYRSKQNERARSSNWKKKSDFQNKPSTSTTATSVASSKAGSSRMRSRSSSSSSSRSPTPEPKSNEQNKSQASRDDFLTDQQMNELGAKLVKAEIMGNDDLAHELKEKLDRARKFRSEHKSEVLAKSFERRTQGAPQSKREKEEKVVLTTTNSKGQSRPIASFRDDSDLWGGRAGRKAKKQKVETHLDGERVRYFADDDKYDIKRMVSFSYNHRSINSIAIQSYKKKNLFFSLRLKNSHQQTIQICNLLILLANIKIQMMTWKIYLRIKCERIYPSTIWIKRKGIVPFENIKTWNVL